MILIFWRAAKQFVLLVFHGLFPSTWKNLQYCWLAWWFNFLESFDQKSLQKYNNFYCFKLQRDSQSPFNAENQLDKIKKIEYHPQLKNCGTFWVKKKSFFAVQMQKNKKGWAKFWKKNHRNPSSR